MLSKGQMAILKIAAVQPYLLMHRNCFLGDTSGHREEYISKVSEEFLQWFRRRCDNGENQSRPGKFKKNLSSVLGGDVITRKGLQTDGWTLDGLSMG